MWGAERYWEVPRNWEQHIVDTLAALAPAKQKRSAGGAPYEDLLDAVVEHVQSAGRGV